MIPYVEKFQKMVNYYNQVHQKMVMAQDTYGQQLVDKTILQLQQEFGIDAFPPWIVFYVNQKQPINRKEIDQMNHNAQFKWYLAQCQTCKLHQVINYQTGLDLKTIKNEHEQWYLSTLIDAFKINTY
jgi:hypothetical protein